MPDDHQMYRNWKEYHIQGMAWLSYSVPRWLSFRTAPFPVQLVVGVRLDLKKCGQEVCVS